MKVLLTYTHRGLKYEKKLLFFLLLTLLGRPVFSQPHCTQVVYFDKGDYQLSDPAKTSLRQFTGMLQGRSTATITVSGFADGQGDSAFNMALSKKRANAVRNFLITRGINKNSITLKYHGETVPVGHSRGAPDNEKDRKVVIMVKMPNHTETHLGSVRKKGPYKLIVPSSKMRKGEEIYWDLENTSVRFPANSLLLASGEPASEDVRIELTEFYKPSEMVQFDFSSQDKEQSPEYIGAIYISAQCQCGELQLKRGRPVEIIPLLRKKTLVLSDLEAFAGVQQEGIISWKQSELVALAWDTSDAKPTGKNNPAGKMNSLLIKSGQLGWIGYARAYTPGEKTHLRVETDTSCKPLVSLVFKDIHSIMVPARKTSDGAFLFENVPVGRKATLVILGWVAGRVKYAVKEITAGAEPVQKLMVLKPGEQGLEKAMEQLDR